MAWDINHVIVIGRLVRDPELSYTPNQTPICKFTIANNRRAAAQNEKDNANFFNIVAWNKSAELCGQFLKKGKRCCIEGRLQQHSYEDKSGQKRSAVEIIVNTVQFLDAGSATKNDEIQAAAPQSRFTSKNESQPADDFNTEDMIAEENEVPF
ncbi:MAG: hypothetical protein A2096_00525 [Spirochaetes bacterium GWF1_41_5]|nr:MAG: hypothetical protein A2096_00525 [Spirochaetes bacterium GWF1_41_5]HBE03427.1 single-stranded DNA-binding protein [Spirochaetia bacterium]